MIRRTLADIAESMEKLAADIGDAAKPHEDADGLLCEALTIAGSELHNLDTICIVTAFKKMRKWYE